MPRGIGGNSPCAAARAAFNAFSSGGYTSTGEANKKSREQLIGELGAKFAGTGINTDDIKAAVYGSNRNASEGSYTPGKASTPVQAQAATYATRIANSSPILQDTLPKISKTEFQLGKLLPNQVRSADYQRFITAAKDIVAANLRKESGAAISQSELDDAFQRYIPVPGDKPAVIADKAKTRDLILQGLSNESGGAYRPSSSSTPTADPLGIR